MKNPQPHNFWSGSEQNLIAVAHRGGDGAGIEKENSMAAFKAAYALGYRWFETDVIPTRDGKLLAIHGRGFQRHPNKDLPTRFALQRLSYEEVKEKVKVGGEPPVLLEELLDAFPDVKFFLDPKTYKAAPLLAEVLASRKSDIQRVWVASFLPWNTSRVKRAVNRSTKQDLGVALLGPTISSLIRLSSVIPVFAPFASFHLKITGAKSTHVPYKWITGRGGIRFVTTAHSMGLRVAVYTPNDAATISACMEKGVDIIMSDTVGALREIALSKDPQNPSLVHKA